MVESLKALKKNVNRQESNGSFQNVRTSSFRPMVPRLVAVKTISLKNMNMFRGLGMEF